MRFFLIILLLLFFSSSTILAASDPRDNPNNKVGVGVLSPEADLKDAASMVNGGGGEWGWILIVIEKDEKNLDRWQNVFNQLSKYKLIPIVRIATNVDSDGNWQRPTDEDAHAWADFFAKLYWPTKNRYIQVYNEVNRSTEWGGSVDPFGYATELDKTISELKSKSDDFFVLNAPLDLALPSGKDSLEASEFFRKMEEGRPGIFKRLDGWASHSYPNPAFSASPYKSGRTGIDGYKWELSDVGRYLNSEDMPVFITETGWDQSAVSEDQVAKNYEIAFKEIWSDRRVAAVTPFVFSYSSGLFNSFSFKSTAPNAEQKYYAQYEKIKSLPKVKGEPKRDNIAAVLKMKTPPYILKGATRKGTITLQNLGNYVWDTSQIKIETDNENLEVSNVSWDSEEAFGSNKINATFDITAKDDGVATFSVWLSDETDVLAGQGKQISVETYAMRLKRYANIIF